MNASVSYLPEAEDDIANTHAYYEQQLAGLGEEFLKALQVVVQRICENPELHGKIRNDIRAVQLRRFPYVVYYRNHGTRVLVITEDEATELCDDKIGNFCLALLAADGLAAC